MRWKTTVVGLLAALAVGVGCKQQCFLYECDANATYAGLGLSPRLENDPTPSIVPATGSVGKPASIDDAERPSRYLSLAEAFALALENGDPGTQALNGTTNKPVLLPSTYVEDARALSEKQAALAGYRLADTIKAIFAAKP